MTSFSARRFCVRFLALLALGFALPLLAPVRNTLVGPWNRLLSEVTAGGLGALGLGARAIAGSVVGSGFALEVIDACNGLDAIVVFAAAVLALQGTWRVRVVALVTGASVLTLLNIVRLMSLYYLGIAHPAWLDPAHYYVWQSAMILASLLLWGAWMGRLLASVAERPALRAPTP